MPVSQAGPLTESSSRDCGTRKAAAATAAHAKRLGPRARRRCWRSSILLCSSRFRDCGRGPQHLIIWSSISNPGSATNDQLPSDPASGNSPPLRSVCPQPSVCLHLCFSGGLEPALLPQARENQRLMATQPIDLWASACRRWQQPRLRLHGPVVCLRPADSRAGDPCPESASATAAHNLALFPIPSPSPLLLSCPAPAQWPYLCSWPKHSSSRYTRGNGPRCVHCRSRAIDLCPVASAVGADMDNTRCRFSLGFAPAHRLWSSLSRVPQASGAGLYTRICAFCCLRTCNCAKVALVDCCNGTYAILGNRL